MVNELRCAIRRIWGERRHTAAVVVILACGMGMATSVFTVYEALFLRPLPIEEPGKVVVVRRQGVSGSLLRLDRHSYAFVRDSPHPFAALAGVAEGGGVMSAGERTESVGVLAVAGDFFGVLGRAPLEGGAFATGAVDDVVILGERVAQRFFGSAQRAVGGTVSLDGRSRLVVGVMGEELVGLFAGEVWIPAMAEAASYEGRREFLVLGRLGLGVDLAAAETRVGVLSERFLQQTPEMSERFARFDVSRYGDYVRSDLLGVTMLLSVSVGLVLLLTCVNGAGLVLARGVGRRTELVTRLALGASRGRIVGQLLLETLVLAVVAGVVGVGIAVGGVRGVVMLLDAGRIGSIAIDERVLLFALAISCVSGLGCGIVPAVVCARVDLASALRREGSGLGAARHAPWLRRGLVVAQMSVSFVLVVLAVLFVAATLAAMRVAPGFDSERVVVAAMALSSSEEVGSGEQAAAFFDEGVGRLLGVSGVEAVAVGSSTPGRRSLNAPQELSFRVGEDRAVSLDWRYVTPGYFQTMGIPLRQGREFNAFDRANTAAVAMVNQAFVVRHGVGGGVIGQRVRIPVAVVPAAGDSWREIVGVVGDVVGPGRRPDRPAVYVPVAQVAPEFLRLVHGNTAAVWFVRLEPGASAGVRREAAEELRALDREAPLSEFRRANDILATSLRDQRDQTVLLGALALFALAVTAGGVYGLMSFLVAVQAREFGVRLALGLSEARVLVSVVSEGFVLAVVSSATGGFLWMLARAALGPVMGGAPGMEPVALAAAVGVLAIVALTSPWKKSANSGRSGRSEWL